MSLQSAPFFSENAGYVEEMYARYQQDPQSVGFEWRAFFDGFTQGFGAATELAGGSLPAAPQAQAPASAPTATSDASSAAFELKCAGLVQEYKKFGHLFAKTNPLKPGEPFQAKGPRCEVGLERHGFTSADLGKTTHAGLALGLGAMSLDQLIAACDQLFCGSVGLEFEHIECPDERAWLLDAFQDLKKRKHTSDEQKTLFTELAKADAFEQTLATKFIGKKRYSIEGADAQIPALESFIDEASRLGTKEFALAMAHRGRLAILTHVVQKPLNLMLAEFEGYPNPKLPGDQDVKYHAGWETDRSSRSGRPVRVSMSWNPSHLEFVNSVVQGEVRARQEKYHGGSADSVIPIVLHGDAAFSGQGVVFETIQMMNLEGYGVGGTLHVVANNQVGFTTNPSDSRTSTYCTDVAKVIQAPVAHVHGEDPEAINALFELAARYRARFHKDFVVDIVCFRRHGHNEGDEPLFTQPLMYKIIKEKPTPWKSYLNVLTAQGHDAQVLQGIYNDLRASMNAVYDEVKAQHTEMQLQPWQRDMARLSTGTLQDLLNSSLYKGQVPLESLKAQAQLLTTFPSTFTPNGKIARIVIDERKAMAEGKKKIDWGMAELLAYSTLLKEGTNVRMTGEDVRRGTFSHRHAVLVDTENATRFNTLQSSCEKGAKAEFYDSLLSECAVMGFEYGYATRHDNSLVIWEAQFGDFANGAQVIIDQFVASGESKWFQPQGLVILLPHGQNGQGPEHSSARVERYLQLCAEGNMQVAWPTHAKQIYHLLRRQMLRDFRKPLVVFTPKDFIRNPRVATSFEELANSTFDTFLDDPRSGVSADKVKTIIFTAGKLGIDLLDASEKDEHKEKASSFAIVRVEQLYPFDVATAVAILQKYKKATRVVWAQEETQNNGCWSYMAPLFTAALEKASHKAKLSYAGRSGRASPAVGIEKQYVKDQEKLVAGIFDGADFGEVFY